MSQVSPEQIPGKNEALQPRVDATDPLRLALATAAMRLRIEMDGSDLEPVYQPIEAIVTLGMFYHTPEVAQRQQVFVNITSDPNLLLVALTVTPTAEVAGKLTPSNRPQTLVYQYPSAEVIADTLREIRTKLLLHVDKTSAGELHRQLAYKGVLQAFDIEELPQQPLINLDQLAIQALLQLIFAEEEKPVEPAVTRIQLPLGTFAGQEADPTTLVQLDIAVDSDSNGGIFIHLLHTTNDHETSTLFMFEPEDRSGYDESITVISALVTGQPTQVASIAELYTLLQAKSTFNDSITNSGTSQGK